MRVLKLTTYPRALGAALLYTFAFVSCGGDSSPVAPSPVSPAPPPVVTPAPTPTPPQSTVPTIAGTWNGTHELTFFGERTFSFITIAIEQDGRAITNGEWRLTSPGWDIKGNLTGRIIGEGSGAAFAGTTTLIAETASGNGRCNATAPVTSEGPLTGNTMRLVAPNITARDCRNDQIRSMTWIFNR